MQGIVSMVESGSIVLLSVLIVSAIHSRFANRFWVGSALLGLLFTLVGVVVMENGFEVVPGILTDPRGAVVVLSAAFGGPVSVAITASSLAFLRLAYGGVGAVAGATYILGTGLAAGLLWCWWFQYLKQRPTILYVVSQAIVAGTVPSVILLTISNAPWDVFLVSNALLIPTNFLATVLMGSMLVRDFERSHAIREHDEKQAQIDAIAEHAPVALFQIVRDRDGMPNFTYVSRAVERIIEVRPDDLLADFEKLDTISDGEVTALIKDKLEASVAEFGAWSHEMSCRTSGGQEKWIYIRAGIRKDRDGRCVWDGSIVDVTERKITEKLQDEFISTVSHELRTPLTSIRGSLGLVLGLGTEQLPDKLLGMLNIANRNAERLVLLINDLLDMQKIRSGKMRMSMKRQEIRFHVDDAITSAANYAPDKKIRLVVEDHVPAGEAMIDPARLDQVLANLLSNAIKFSPKEGVVTTSIHHVDDKIRISVTDEGPGIPAAFRDRIFKPFCQNEMSNTRSVGGTGLGLNISKALVEAMDGTLWFDSIEGSGTTFHVDLPAVSVQGMGGLMPNVLATGRRVLICSNDGDLTRTATETAAPLSLVADIAQDADAAYGLACRNQYAALVLDAGIGSPAPLLNRLAADERTRDFPVIAVVESGEDDCGAVTETLIRLAKPLEKVGLRQALDAVLAMRPARSHILYVEDDTYLHEIFRQHLGEDVNMTSARTLTEARSCLATGKFDLILLDLELPDGAGQQLVKEIAPSTPIIVFSAYDVDPDVARYVKGVMTKSRVKEAEVAQTVLATLAGKPLDRSHLSASAA
ncbi:PAS domain-containing protein [Palleronia aestuarii]|uniref:histidine kinase n=1 Tax=Palleronia aestuarii TaxID=568105 RepID=A0A2W7NUF8_9RHOB|nr:ATP-binding protein [Palleronia aestuarii]PZX16976.1 PAS domain-containing protein [Palleronia aestuarii]